MPIRHAARVVLAVLALSGLPATPPALAGKPKVEELAPFTPWNVDWSDKTCVLQRGFGTEADPVLLRMEQFTPGSTFQMVLIGRSFAKVQQGDALTIRYGEGVAVQQVDRLLVGKAANGSSSIYITWASLAGLKGGQGEVIEPTPETERKVTYISFAKIRGRELVLKTGPLDKAFAAWRQCTDQLVRSWGLDPAQQAHRQSPPKPLSEPRTWLRSGDYPVGALAKGAQALVNFRLNVDATGTPTECEIQRSYSGELFDKVSCSKIMARARFQPALDEAGKPIASYFATRIIWIMSP